MELSIPPSTRLWRSCRLLQQPPSTSASCRILSCNSACRMATRATALRRSTTLSTRHNRLYLRRGLVKRVWEDHLDRTQMGHRARDRKHLSKGHTPASKVPSTVAHNFKHLRRTRHPFNMRAVMPAFLHRCRTNSTIPRLYPNACLPCPRPHSHQRFRTSALGRPPHIRNMGVGSIPPRMEHHRMYKGCHTVTAQPNLLIHRLPPTMRSLARPSSINPHRTFTSSSSSSSNNNNNACTRYDSGS